MPMITCDLGHACHGYAFVFCVYYCYFYFPIFHGFNAPLFIVYLGLMGLLVLFLVG